MKIKTIFNLSRMLLLQPSVFVSHKSYLFILSHMRSRSSLLSHILGSNEQIHGYGELHQSYRDKIDLARWRYKVCLDTREEFHGNYLVDKILHNKYEISDSILSRDDVRFIFLVRDPDGTLKSLVRLGHYYNNWYKQPDQILGYYNKRLRVLEAFCQIVERKKPIFIESNQLVDCTEPLLAFLTTALNLESRLRPFYKIFYKTGHGGHGDPSACIKSGRIVKTNHGDIDTGIQPDAMDYAVKNYERCIARLRNCCHCLD